jgi:hypothetical protein
MEEGLSRNSLEKWRGRYKISFLWKEKKGLIKAVKAEIKVSDKRKLITVLNYVIKHYAIKGHGEVEMYLHHS